MIYRTRYGKPINPPLSLAGLGPAPAGFLGRYSNTPLIDLGEAVPDSIILTITYDMPVGLPGSVFGVGVSTGYLGAEGLEDSLPVTGSVAALLFTGNNLVNLGFKGFAGYPPITPTGVRTMTYRYTGPLSRQISVVAFYYDESGPPIGLAAGQGIVVVPVYREVVAG